jgi:hypothetical protein
LEREIRSSEEFCGPGDFTIDFDEWNPWKFSPN